MTASHTEHPADDDEDNLARAAAQGPLPGTASQDVAADRGEDHSATNDPETKANKTGRDDIVGGLVMG